MNRPNRNPPWTVRKAAMLARAEKWFRDNVAEPKPIVRRPIARGTTKARRIAA